MYCGAEVSTTDVATGAMAAGTVATGDLPGWSTGAKESAEEEEQDRSRIGA